MFGYKVVIGSLQVAHVSTHDQVAEILIKLVVKSGAPWHIKKKSYPINHSIKEDSQPNSIS